MPKTKIEWTQHSWNPITGCTKISAGCKNCYAERMARRLAGRYGYPEAPHHFDVALHPDRLEQPLKRQKPTTYFVCSMSDLFHEDVSDEWRYAIFKIMAAADRHIFQVLTKRADAMLEFCSSKWYQDLSHIYGLHNVWLGVSAENQQATDERIPILLQIPAAVRFVSVEPMLEAVTLPYHSSYVQPDGFGRGGPMTDTLGFAHEPDAPIDWAIVGGESGPGARPMHPDWARGIRDQCQVAGVPFFFKQWGRYAPLSAFPIEYLPPRGIEYTFDDYKQVYRVGKKAAGRLLDGREWNEMPQSGH